MINLQSSTITLDDAIFLLSMLCVIGVALLVIVHRSIIVARERKLESMLEMLGRERDLLREKADAIEAMMGECEALTSAVEEAKQKRVTLLRHYNRERRGISIFIHEIGRPEPGRTLFRFPIRTLQPHFSRPETRIIFHPHIWQFHNEAHVWATDLPSAIMLARTVFNEKSGVFVSNGGDEPRTMSDTNNLGRQEL